MKQGKTNLKKDMKQCKTNKKIWNKEKQIKTRKTE